MFWVKCALVVATGATTGQIEQVNGLLLEKNGDEWLVDFEYGLRKADKKFNKPYAKVINGNECLFVDKPMP